MIDYAARHLDPLGLTAAAAGIDPGTDAVPRFYVQTLSWAYLGGAEFVGALLGNDARRWARVDRALRGRAPTTTEQVLHPGRYRRGEQGAEVNARLGAAARRRGWLPVYRGSLGELATAQVLRLGAPNAIADRAAAGWGGDAFTLASRDRGGTDCGARCRATRALVVVWRWDSARDREEFLRTLPAWLVGALRGRPRGEAVWRLRDGWAALSREGLRTRLAFGPTRRLARTLAG